MQRIAIQRGGPTMAWSPVGSLLFGNDHPPVWTPLDGPVALLDNLMSPSDADRAAIRWRNAARFGYRSR